MFNQPMTTEKTRESGVFLDIDRFYESRAEYDFWAMIKVTNSHSSTNYETALKQIADSP